MKVVHTISELEEHDGGAFVPTMGALHEGHLALIRHAASLGGTTIISIFVNPTQFGPSEDFQQYPRRIEHDLQLAETHGATIAFLPEPETIYPPEESIPVPPLPAVATQPALEDACRPHHFAGVCQVVARLFDLVHPHWAIFGEKDYQQLLVIRAMVAQEQNRWPNLNIIAQPTVREPDGLALSSRNINLSPQERPRALGLIHALLAAQQSTSPQTAEQAMRRILAEHDLKIDYAVVRDSSTLTPITRFSRPARALIAARLGAVRLIDNISLTPDGE